MYQLVRGSLGLEFIFPIAALAAPLCRHKRSEVQQYPYYVSTTTRNGGFYNVSESTSP